MKGIVIDPRRRVTRRLFVWDLIIPNILAGAAILLLKVLDLGMATDIGVGAIAALLLWSANFAAPVARLHDMGAPALLHVLVVVAVFFLTVIGPVGPGEAFGRIAAWGQGLLSEAEDLPPVNPESARIGGAVALVQVLVLALWPGQKGRNRYGGNPRDKNGGEP